VDHRPDQPRIPPRLTAVTHLHEVAALQGSVRQGPLFREGALVRLAVSPYIQGGGGDGMRLSVDVTEPNRPLSVVQS
jgi:hypothetical protein